MAEQITYLLKDALTDLESIQEYYHWQLKVTNKYIRKNISKYKYAIALDKFFYNLTNETDKMKISEEENLWVEEVLESYEVKEKEEDSIVEYRLKNTDGLDGYELVPEKGRNGFRKLVDRDKILRESTLIILLIKYEECIMGIFRYLLEAYPNAYLSDKSISYAELINLNVGLQEIRNHFIDNEIEEIMRKPISDWYKLISDKHKVKYAFDNDTFSAFKKVYYRRNLIVHNQGIINDTYLRNTNDDEYNLGDRLMISSAYIDQAISLAKELLIGTFWGIKKLAPDKAELNDYLFNYGYDCLVEREWDLAKFINKMLMEDTSQQDAELLCERVNYWIAEKNINGLESIKEEIEALDVSVMNKQFVVAKHALLNEYRDVSRELEKAIADEIPANYVTEWPLFNEYRETDEYKEFVKKNQDKFAVFGYTSENESNDSDLEETIDIDRDKKDLIEKLRNSKSFQETHLVINNLDDYCDWSNDNIEELSRIALTNTQVQWIIDDDDIRNFFGKLLDSTDNAHLGDYTKQLKEYYKKKNSANELKCD